MIHPEQHVCLNPVSTVARVVATTAEYDAVDGRVTIPLSEGVERVSELNLATSAGFLLVKNIKDFWAQHVPANDGEVRWRFLRGRFLDEAGDLHHIRIVGRFNGGAPVQVDGFLRNLYERNNRCLALVMFFHHA